MVVIELLELHTVLPVESTTLKLYTVLDVGLIERVAPDPIGAPAQPACEK
jgi:hypothetical protein